VSTTPRQLDPLSQLPEHLLALLHEADIAAGSIPYYVAAALRALGGQPEPVTVGDDEGICEDCGRIDDWDSLHSASAGVYCDACTVLDGWKCDCEACVDGRICSRCEGTVGEPVPNLDGDLVCGRCWDSDADGRTCEYCDELFPASELHEDLDLCPDCLADAEDRCDTCREPLAKSPGQHSTATFIGMTVCCACWNRAGQQVALAQCDCHLAA
jgi:hypothetical protein